MNKQYQQPSGVPDSVSIVSPGLLPVPPILGGSVETVIHKMAQVTSKSFNIDIYGPSHRLLPILDNSQNPAHYRFPAKISKEYFQSVRSEISKKPYSIIQVENRPLFIPKTKPLVPGSKFICSLHSLIHIEEKLIRHHFTQKIFNQCDKVLIYSQFIRDRLIEMFPIVADKFHFIHLGTEPSRFVPRWRPEVQGKLVSLKRKYNIPENHKIIMFAGRVIPKKGVHVLLKAMKQVMSEYPNCCLVIVGSSWFGNWQISPYIEELYKLADPLKHKIRFTNYVSPQVLPYYFALADVFVCPSQWDEPFGLVNVEAMASGVPVVASKRGGIPEIITDGDNGFLISNESNPSSFAKAILRLLNEPDMARTFGVNGRLAVEKYFNWQRAGKQLVNLYEDLLNGR